jgi:large subunit ribosomal protein L35
LPKMKSHSGAKSRFKVTRSGKITRRKANAGHFKIKKKSARGRRLKQMDEVSKADRKQVKRLIGR